MLDVKHDHFHAVTERVTQHVEITEKKAPTDESVRLLREMEAEAQKRILTTTRVQDMGIDCVIHKMEDVLNDQTKFALIYSMNGAKHRVLHDINNSSAGDRLAVASELRDALAQHIAGQLLAGAFAKLGKVEGKP